MRVGVVGTGYVGLVLGAGLADSGNRVICGDIDKAKIDMLNHGEIPIFEPGLAEMVARNSSHGRLTFTTDIPQLVRDSDVIFIAVGTPPSEDGSADLGHVLNVAATIADNMDGYRLVVVKSTVPVGTCDKVREVIASRTKHIFDVASNPEFLKEGEAVRDMMKPDRIVIGTDNERARELLEEVYVTFVRTGNPIIFMDIKSSEMTKYASNAMLATRISFMNEMASICTKIGADIDMVRHGMGADPRIGSKFLFAGVGYGGSCFPKDVKALIATGVDNGLEVPLLHAVEHINAKQKTLLVDMVVDHFGEDLSGLKFAMWGLSFKPNTDDMREAPSIEIIKGLTAKGATVVATDPVAMENAAVILKGNERVSFLADEYEVVSGVDALLLVTEWGTFRAPSFSRLATAMKQKVIFDGRNIWQPAKLREMGFEYYGIGRP
ncbi:MAG TPA: UDP-glucose/GDP-mannose dehydrogenase family protein [Myxococcota bacterium]|mgnify:FL=1|nr:UDP-glucose/GDP-mannose dehydrogenase family protein [Myxococcota bacterium]HOS62821.1 UDP-glucose/GDP-mannose dehydrogenase family protein [Myxococcota bacterium]HQE74423.1 UDP-glucose/GDP-mannose dehydrogenase family protein [Myxococcota bacterium]HQI62593.1 UDP-glucose/GDP-mannose dehydrogenase family protein [Myxococcota bacterium]